VLAAVERLGESTLPQIKAQFAGLNASDVLRVLDALIRRGLVEWCGDPHLVYLGDAPVAVIDDDDVVRFRATPLDR
jgi:DNA-binding IclR family transcriptional regulator